MSTISKPYTFSPSTTASSSEVNADFDTLYNDYNGNIDASNLAAGAVSTAKIADDAVTIDKIADSAVGSGQLVTGIPVQMVSTGFSAVATGATVMPVDDTIPQNTEGVEFMTQAITPKSATNVLVVEVLFMGAPSAADYITLALFQDSTANAISATTQYRNDANAITVTALAHTMVAGTTSSTTFKIRGGMGGAGTLTFNGNSATRRFGAINKSFIKITEYKA